MRGFACAGKSLRTTLTKRSIATFVAALLVFVVFPKAWGQAAATGSTQIRKVRTLKVDVSDHEHHAGGEWWHIHSCDVHLGHGHVATSVALPSPPAEQAGNFDSGDRALDIPIAVEDSGMVFAQFKVNGVGPVWLTLDTGASVAVINSAFAKELKIAISGKGVVRGAGGAQPTEEGAHVEFSLPGVALRDQTVSVYAMELSRRVGRPVAGVIGREFFEAFVVEIDFANQRMHLYDPRTYRYQGNGSVVPLSFDRSNGLPCAQGTVVMLNKKRVQERFLLDLGSAFPLILQEKYAAEHGLLKTLPARISIQAGGTGGALETVVGRVAAIQLGEHTLKAPFAAFPQRGPGYVSAVNSPGIIGAPVLSRFHVIFDYAHNRLILERGERFAEPFEFDMSGLGLVADGEAFDQVRIARIIPGSPAEAAGFAVGDRILSVNGQAVTEVAILRRLLREPDRQLDIIIRRGQSTQTVKLTTRRMI